LSEGYTSSYNQGVKVERLHSWQVSITQALDIQQRLAAQVSRSSQVGTPRFIAGVDISADKGRGVATGAVVVLHYPELGVAETKVVTDKLNFPYIPGLLSFREAPLILAACQKLTITPDLILVDGQGIAHPRGIGLASHMGLWFDIPSIGCTKTPLLTDFISPGPLKGSFELIRKGGKEVGAVLRTKDKVKPVFVSPGYRIDLSTSIQLILESCRGFRFPEPLRKAHQASRNML